MAYEVIKRVGGRAYRYRVESYRDPETRRVRGKWTYLGRVEGEGTLSPERQARPSSRSRLLDALERLLELHEIGALSTGMVAHEAGLAYGTFYRYFKDLDHVVREAMLRHGATTERLREVFLGTPGTVDEERDKLSAWVEEIVANAQARPGLLRAWHVASNQDAAVVAERQLRFDAMVDNFTDYIERLRGAGLAKVSAPPFNAYALVALITAVVRECAVDRTFTDVKLAGILEVIIDLAGLPERPRIVAVA
ncbi:MAG: hypothetical protein NVSMB64_02250 [Candidatus Velthaea sp.]